MKRFIYILPVVFAIFLVGCEEDPDTHTFPPADVDFSYSITEGDYTLDYIIGSTIEFENVSVLTGAPSWDFGDGTTSTEPAPKHVYDTPGNYEVKLTVDGKLVSKKILISDMKAQVKYSSSDGEVSIINSSVITIDITLPNPGGYEAIYKWILPEGTMDENGNEVTESNNPNPGKLKFKHVGSQQLRLETSIVTDKGVRKLDTERVNVQIGYNESVKTIYMACKDGYVRAMKLIPNLPSSIKNKQFNLPASSGSHGFNLIFNNKDTVLYVLDAGKQYYYVNDVDANLGDGKITVVSKDGKNVEVLVSNVGKTAFDDPFYGYFDETNRTLYFSDRNTGIRAIGVDSRNASVSDISYTVQNNQLGYYNNGIVFGAGNANFTRVGSTWWWGKYFGSSGIYRFTSADIGNTTVVPSAGVVMSGGFIVIKSFVVDQTNSMVYFAALSPVNVNGFYAMPLSAFEAATTAAAVQPYRVAEFPTDAEGTDTEKVFISQLTLDSEDGSVYFGYRAGDGATQKTGLKRYNPKTKLIETYLEGLEIYGVAINDKKAKLF